MKTFEVFIPVLCVGIGAFVTWFLTRKKTTAERYKTELDILQMWKSIADDLKAEVLDLTKKCSQLSEQVEIFRKENISLKSDLKRFENIIKQKIG